MKRLFPVIHIENALQTLRNVEKCNDVGTAGIFLIHHRANYKKLLAIAEKVHSSYPLLWVGINALDLTAAESFRLMPIWVKGIWSDNLGITEDAGIFNVLPAAATQPFRRMHPAEYFGGFAFKYQHPIVSLETGALKASKYCDTITTSGDGTGIAADITKIKRIKNGKLWSARLGIASGITPDNIAEYLPFVDDFLVATGISDDEHNLNREKLLNLNQKIVNYQ